MTVGVVIQARMSSRRLPGKMLRPLGEQTLLERVVRRVRQVQGADAWAVATSDSPSDDPLAEFCAAHAIPVLRGSLDDVAGRLWHAARQLALDHVVRISGDSPFIHPALVARGIRLALGGDVDLATNVYPRTFPRGQSVEVLRTAALAAAAPEMGLPSDREHVTPCFYRDPSRWRIASFVHSRDLSAQNMSVDTPADWRRARAFVARHPDFETMSPEQLMAAFTGTTAEVG